MATASSPQRVRPAAPVRVLVLVDGGALGSTAAAAHVLSRWQEDAGVPVSQFVAATAGLGWGAAVAVMAAMPSDTPLGARLGFITEPSGVFGHPLDADPSRAARFKRTLLRAAIGDATLSDLQTHVISGLLDVRRRQVVPVAHAPPRASQPSLRRLVDALTATPLAFSPVRLSLSSEAAANEEAVKGERWFADASRVWSREAFALHAMLAMRRQLAPGESLAVVRIRAGVSSPERPSMSALKYGSSSVWASVEQAARAPCATTDLRDIAAAIDVEFIDIEPEVPAKYAVGNQPHRAWREAAAAAYAAHRARLMTLTERACAQASPARPAKGSGTLLSVKASPPAPPADIARKRPEEEARRDHPLVSPRDHDSTTSSADDEDDASDADDSESVDDSDDGGAHDDGSDSGSDDDGDDDDNDDDEGGQRGNAGKRAADNAPPANCNVQ